MAPLVNPPAAPRPPNRPAPGDGRAPWADGDVNLERDRALVLRCQRGQRDAFDELYRRYHWRLQRFCRQRLGDTVDAEDATQEAFAKAWRALPALAGPRRFYPWLTVIAANVCTDLQRRRARVTPVAELPLAEQADQARTAEEQLVAAVDGAMAVEALGNLSRRHRRLLTLREGSGWSTARIATHEGTSVPVVETTLWRARQALRREFAALADVGGRLVVGLAVLGVLARRLAGRGARRVTAGTARVASVTGIDALPRGVGAGLATAGAAAVITGALVTGPFGSTGPPAAGDTPQTAGTAGTAGTPSSRSPGPSHTGAASATGGGSGTGAAGAVGPVGTGASPGTAGTKAAAGSVSAQTRHGPASGRDGPTSSQGLGHPVDGALGQLGSRVAQAGAATGQAVSGGAGVTGGAVGSAGGAVGGTVGALGGAAGGAVGGLGNAASNLAGGGSAGSGPPGCCRVPGAGAPGPG